MTLKSILAIVASTICFLSFCAFSSANDDPFLKMLDTQVETPTRSLRPYKKTSENISVVTAKEIETMNAHNLAEILDRVVGVQMFMTGGPWSPAQAYIQGSEQRHVTVILDNIRFNSPEGVAEISMIPAHLIERIEIVKGPASSSWGSALGGVINVITKAGRDQGAGGSLYGSYGEKATYDVRSELTAGGRPGNIYIAAGKQATDGFRLQNDFHGKNIYAKLGYKPVNNLHLTATAGYMEGDRGIIEMPAWNLIYRNAYRLNFATIGSDIYFKSTIVNATLRGYGQHLENRSLMSGALFDSSSINETGIGGSVKISHNYGSHHLVAGLDTDSKRLRDAQLQGGEHRQDKQAVFVNDSIYLDQLTVAPGLRYDHVSINGAILSPSLGLTYDLDHTIFRAAVSRGFNAPEMPYVYGRAIIYTPNTNLGMEKVWSIHAGVETNAPGFLTLKASAFRHEITDTLINSTLPDGTHQYINGGRQRRQGAEVEVKTAPLYNTSFHVGGTVIDARDLTAGKSVENVPKYTIEQGIEYKGPKVFAALTGHYIRWNINPLMAGKYSSMLFDLNLSTEVRTGVQLFITAHNLFNGTQYVVSPYYTPRRWLEAGIRYNL